MHSARSKSRLQTDPGVQQDSCCGGTQELQSHLAPSYYSMENSRARAGVGSS